MQPIARCGLLHPEINYNHLYYEHPLLNIKKRIQSMTHHYLRSIALTAFITAAVTNCFAQEDTPGTSIVVDNAVLKVVEERSIPARTSGIVQQNSIREGTLVEIDQPVMQIDNSEMLIQLEKTKKELEMAKHEAASRVDLEFAKRSIEVTQAELGRALRSNQRRPGVVPQSELDQLSLEVKKSIAEKEKTEFQMQMREMTREVRQVELELENLHNDFHQIKSPIKGMIVEVKRHEGEWVEASESVARVIRLDKLRAEVKLPAEKALKNLVGSTATFYPKLDGAMTKKAYTGKVVFIYPEANPISSEVRVWVEIENSNLKLIPGLTGRLEIQPDPDHKVVNREPPAIK